MKDLESGITLMKDKNDRKNWTKRDIIKMRKSNTIKGYDVSYNGNFVTFDMSEIQYIYLVENVDEPNEIEEVIAKKGEEVMFV